MGNTFFFNEIKRIRPLTERIEDSMIKNHNIAYGCWGIPSSARPTFSRGEFYENALRLGECTQEEFNDIYKVLKSIWLRDLSD